MTRLDFLPLLPEMFPNASVAKVVSSENQSLRVAWMGTTWPAELYTLQGETVFKLNQPVKVHGRKGITLLISA